jgi:thymidylate synthase
MNKEEIKYLRLLEHILQNGDERSDRTGVGTFSIFGTQLRFSLEHNRLPLLTTKQMFVKGIIEELLFFIRGETDTKKLEAKGVYIWKGNTSREFLDKKGLTSYEEGDMGPMYGYQWRNFSTNRDSDGIDQLQNAFDLIKNDPDSRRIMVTAYNPLVSHKIVLEPCHMFFQFYVSNGELSLQWYQRSVDIFLGLPFNIASYAMLTHLMAKATGTKAKELIFVGGDTHLYSTHIEQVKIQIDRDPCPFPTLRIEKDIDSIEDMENLSFDDFIIENYKYYPPIKATMAI